jgi:predicted dehydrogenase
VSVGFGILGAGTISHHFVSALALVREAEVVAVASRTEANASAFASEFAIPHLYSDYEDLFSDPRVDVVYVATPAGLHHEHSLLAIESGKAVLCEKPFATNAARARKVVAAARARGVFCMEAMWMRFLPLVRDLQTRVARGDIGAVRALNANLSCPIPFAESSRYYEPDLGGGSLLDLGVYPVSLASMLLGPPAGVHAVQMLVPSGVDTQMTVILEYPESLATLTCGFTGTGQNGAFIVGSEGYIEVEAPIYAPTRMHITRTGIAPPPDGNGPSSTARRLERIPAAVELRRRLAPRLKPLLRGDRQRVTKHFRGHGYQYEAAEVVRCLTAGEAESGIMPLDETVAVMDILDAARKAAES